MELICLEHASEGPETAPPLVIAHGLFGSARNFNTLGRKLAVGRRVVLVDMRNHGDSPWSDDVSYSAMAGDLASVIERIGAPAVVLGHSMGGKATMALALSRPDLLAGAIVADIAPVAYPHTHLRLIQAMRAMDLASVTRRSEADPLLAGAVGDPMLRAFLLQNLVIEGGAARWRINLSALEEGMGGLTDWPDTLSGNAFAGPSFFVYGGASEYMTEALKPQMQKSFPGAAFHEIPGAGHWLHAEKPAEFLAVISSWLATV